jgi:hypothetical protein
MSTSHAALALTLLFLPVQAAPALTEAELDRIGHRVWQNECNGTRDGLTSWNAGEDFASLGIGHFIWYPPGVDGPFEESFPKLVQFLATHGAKTAAWMEGDCPWESRAEFQREFHSDRMNQLRDLLASTVRHQSRFLADRMRGALPKMLDSAPAARRGHVKTQFERLAATGAGTFALIDYVNFKGEGTNPRERYKGKGWGLLQVLDGMRADPENAVEEFSRSAAATLSHRVENSPPERNERKWLPGWTRRVREYAG